MKKKRFIIINLLFLVLTFLESGIFTEVLWHGWGGFGDITMEYTAEGSVGSFFLVCFLPVSVMGIFLIRMGLCIKKKADWKAFCFDCTGALAGTGLGLGAFFLIPFFAWHNPVFQWGRQMAALLIDCFCWMEYPIP